MTERETRREPTPEVVDRALDRAAGGRPIPGNRVTLLYDGPAIYPAMLERIAGATRWIHLDSYYIRSDATGRRFAEALTARARAGVAVRVQSDWIGSFTTRRSFWRKLRAAGVEVRSFGPPRLLELRQNLIRDHRKLLVTDGASAIVGGHCIGNEWSGVPEEKRQPWRDTACLIEGPAAAAVDRAFAGLWGATGEPLDPAELRAEAPACGDSAVRVIAGEPGGVRAARITELLLDGAAEKVWICDAYLVAPRGLYQALLDAARNGVDTRLLVPGASDLNHVRNLTRIGYRDLLQAGVRIFEWRGPMLHAKTLVADGRWVRIGSTNLNLSSLLANYELDVLVDDSAIAQALEAQFRRDLERSVEIRLSQPPSGRRSRKLAAVSSGAIETTGRHRRGLRERRQRAVVALVAVVSGARRAILLQYSITLAGLGILFLLLPQFMAGLFFVLTLWLAVAAWFESWGRERR